MITLFVLYATIGNLPQPLTPSLPADIVCTIRAVVLGLLNLLETSTNCIHVLIFTTLVLSALTFLVQNVLLPKQLDTLTKNLTSQNNNQLFIYPYKCCIALLLLSLVSNWDIYESVVLSTNYGFEPTVGVSVGPQFVLDPTVRVFLFTTLSIGLVVNRITPLYMENEPNQQRFYNLLNAFLFSMAFLLMSYNLLTMLLFWELIGLFSYFLINFWSKKASTFKSAIKAMSYNQISDAAFLLGLVLYYKIYGTFTLPYGHALPELYRGGSAGLHTAMVVSFFVAASCKSAQFPLHFWLPDSMDAPAPASSLIHSATLVAAGVFLVLKLRPVWIVETTATSCFEMVTLVTVAIGGMAAAAHTDMKKVLAYSTISNCGFMLYFAITSTVEAASTFFMAHGFFKACAFSTVSILIVASRHKQDYRYTGQTSISAPYLVVPAILSIGSLGSLPLSILQPIKHGTLNIALPDGTLGPVKDILLCIGLISSTLYSTKLILNIMYGQRRILKRRSQEIPNGMYDPIVAVTCFGVCTTTFLYLVHIIKTGPVELNPLVEYLPDHTPYYQHGTYVTTPTKVAYSIADKVQLLGLLCVAFPIWSTRLTRLTIDAGAIIIIILITASIA